MNESTERKIRHFFVGFLLLCTFSITLVGTPYFRQAFGIFEPRELMALMGSDGMNGDTEGGFRLGQRLTTVSVVDVYALSPGGSCGSPYCGTKIGTQPLGALGSNGSTTSALFAGKTYFSVMFDSGVNGYVDVTKLKPAISNNFSISPNGKIPLRTDFALVTKKTEVYLSPGVSPTKQFKLRGAAGRVIGGPVSQMVGTAAQIWWKVDFYHGQDGWVSQNDIVPVESIKITKDARLQTLKGGDVYSVKLSSTPPLYDVTKIGTQPIGRRGTAGSSVVVKTNGSTEIFRYVNFDSGVDGYYPEASLGQPTGTSVSSLIMRKVSLPLPATGSSAMTSLLSQINTDLALDAPMTETGLRRMVQAFGAGATSATEMTFMRVTDNGEIKEGNANEGSIVIGSVESPDGTLTVSGVDTRTNTAVINTISSTDNSITQSVRYNDGDTTTRIDTTVTIITDANGNNLLSIAAINPDNGLETYTITGPVTTSIGPDGSVTVEAAGQTTVNTDGTVYVNEGNVVLSYTPGTAPTTPSDTPYTDSSGESYATSDTAPSESVSTASEMKRYNVISSARPRGLKFPPTVAIDVVPTVATGSGSTYINWRSVGASRCATSWSNAQSAPYGTLKSAVFNAYTNGTARKVVFGVSCTNDGTIWSATSSAVFVVNP